MVLLQLKRPFDYATDGRQLFEKGKVRLDGAFGLPIGQTELQMLRKPQHLEQNARVDRLLLIVLQPLCDECVHETLLFLVGLRFEELDEVEKRLEGVRGAIGRLGLAENVEYRRDELFSMEDYYLLRNLFDRVQDGLDVAIVEVGFLVAERDDAV